MKKDPNNRPFKSANLYFIVQVRKWEDWEKQTNVDSALFFLFYSYRNANVVAKNGCFVLRTRVDLITRAGCTALRNFWNILAMPSFDFICFGWGSVATHGAMTSSENAAAHPAHHFHHFLLFSTSDPEYPSTLETDCSGHHFKLLRNQNIWIILNAWQYLGKSVAVRVCKLSALAAHWKSCSHFSALAGALGS